MSDEKYCVNCKWYFRDESFTLFKDKCYRLYQVKEVRNLVTGKIEIKTVNSYMFCNDERSSLGACGIEGKYFERREIIPEIKPSKWYELWKKN